MGKNVIKSLNTVIMTCGIGAFLVGCDDNAKCKDRQFFSSPQSVIDECRNSKIMNSSSTNTSSGFFAPVSGTHYGTGG